MKFKNKIGFICLLVCLIISTVTISYARYVLNKSANISISAPPVDAGTFNFTITNENSIYNVSNSTEKTTISSTVEITNNYNIPITSYYAWTTSNTAPSDESYLEFSFTNNSFDVTNENVGIGTYYLWVKVKYTNEIGEEKQVVKTSKLIRVVLGDIKIELDDTSDYVTGDVTATISYVGEYNKNTKAGYGKTEEEAIQNATSVNANSITILKEEIDTIYYIYAYAENALGNSITNTIQVDNIDNIKPTINLVTPNFLRAKINVTDNKSGIKEYSVTTTNVEPQTYSNILETASTELETYINNLKKNTTYYLWVKDNVGNVISQEFKTNNLTYTSTPSLTEWTNGNVTINFGELNDAILTYTLSGTNIYTYNKTTGIEISENSTINYSLQDGSNKLTGTITVEHIDKQAPSVNVTSDYEKITITGTDSGSKIVGYFITDTEVQDITKVTFESVIDVASLTMTATKDYLGNNLIYNKQYYIYLKDKVGNVSRGEVISKIDWADPEITISSLTSKTNSVSVSVRASDTESGLTGKYKYYISTKSGVWGKETIESINTKYTFSELEHNVTYYVKVETEDIAGRKSSVTGTIKTTELLVDNDNAEITFTNGTWSKNIQTVTLKTTTTYKMKYQIVKPEGTLEIANSAWSEPISSGTNVTGLEHGDVLYVKLYDGTNNSTNWATYNVLNAMKTNYSTFTEAQVQKMTIANFDILTYSVSKEEIQVATSSKNTGTLTYNYYMKNVKTDEYELMQTSSTFDEQVTIPQASEYNVYSTICVELANNSSGTLTRSKNKATTIAQDPISVGVIADENKTYVDEAHYTATVPKGFKVSSQTGENTVSTGLVLQDENNNEFVWIPVANAIYNEKTTPTTTKYYTPMSRYQKNSTEFFEKIYYSFSGTTGTGSVTDTKYRLGGSSYIEPSLITGSSSDKYTWNVTKAIGTSYDASSTNYLNILGFESVSEFGKYLNQEYKNMTISTDRYGGYLVGRYETTIDNTNKIGTKKGEKIYSNKNWYELYKAQSNNLDVNNIFYGSTVLKSSMITGAEYDAMLNFALTGNDKSKVTSTSMTYGNKTGEIALSGSYENDKISNIYDLISNAYEQTSEASSYSSRVVRGGAYFSNVTGYSSASRMAVVPTDLGMSYGTRMALYLLNSSDKTPPTFEVETEATSSTITVNVVNVEDESSVDKYFYSISISNDGDSWNDDIITNTSTYTFENLTQSRTYYIRVKVTDAVGNESGYIIKSVTTDSLNILSTELYIRSFYGVEPNCTAILDMSKENKDNGFSVKYIVALNSEEIETKAQANISTWNNGTVITGLSEANVIIAKLCDSAGNTGSDYVLFYLDGFSEEFSNKYETTRAYTDSNGDTAYIPAGFKVGISNWINKVENGLVIQDDSGNEFVWVPVPNAIKNSSTSITENYTPMAMNQTGANSKFYESIYYAISNAGVFSYNLSYKLGTSNYREPSISATNTGGANLYTWDIENILLAIKNRDTDNYYYKMVNYNSAEEFGKYMNEEYYNTISSIDKYGGFYIARYETSLKDTTTKTVQAQNNKTPYRSASWYYMNYYQDSNRYQKNPYYNLSSVTSSMIWNAEYNALVNWIFRSNNSSLLTDTKIGNHETIANTGKTSTDIINNVFDLAGNVTEFTMGSYSNYIRIARGGNYSANSSVVNSISNDTATTGGQYGTRMALYINDETDDTNPIITKREDGIDSEENVIYEEPHVTSDSIYVKVNSYDPDNSNGSIGSGIKKYVYSISSTTNENGEFINYIDYEAYGNTFTFSNIEQSSIKYYNIKAKVYDHKGNCSEEIDLGTVQVLPKTIDEQEVFIDALYGTNGSGTIYLDFSDTFEDAENYYIEYQVGKNGANYNESGTWKKNTLNHPQTGVQVDNLSVGDIVYARVTDGVNLLEISEKSIDEEENEVITNLGTSIYSFNITQLEEYGESYATKTEYTDENGDKLTIPTGFAISNLYNEVESGAVIKRIKDDNGNDITDGDEFVWVPVKDAIYDTTRSKELASSATSTNTYKPMARFQGSYKTSDSNYYEGILYNYSLTYKTGSYTMSTGNRVGTSKSNREISLITGSDSQMGWKQEYGENYDASSTYCKSILKFNSAKDFGIHMNQEYTDMVNSVNSYGGFYIARHETSISSGVISSAKNKTPMASMNWYNMYYNQESQINSNNPYYNNTDVIATMVFGSQWDAMLNWTLEGKDYRKVHEIVGNHEGSRATTGKYGSDYINNIFDVSSNVREWTQEANGSTYRVYRGGSYSTYYTYPASYRSNSTTTYAYNNLGSRFTLYVK